MNFEITDLKPQKRRKDRISVFLDGEFAFGLQQATAERLFVGQDLTEPEIDALKQADSVEWAKQTAYRLLSLRPRSTAEVRRHLSKKDVEEYIIDRVIAVPAPATIGRSPIEHPALASEYRVWAESPEQARVILTNATSRYLTSLAAGGREIVIELLGPLLVVYCASDAALSEGDALALGTFADELCQQVLANTPRLSPRGVGY